MKISSIQLEETEDRQSGVHEGLHPFSSIPLGAVVVLAGSNGSGKTRLLKLLEKHVANLRSGAGILGLEVKISQGEDEWVLGPENVSELELVNYSHYDAHLQLPDKFPICVICQAKELLQARNYEETALNALLLLEDMAQGYSQQFQDGTEFQRFIEEYATPLHIQVSKDEEGRLRLFGQLLEDAALSPGQLYLLRVAVACYCNNDNQNLVFLLDEPELHLHPQAQIELVKTLREKFQNAQFWISTHSMTLISYLSVVEKHTTTLYMSDGLVRVLRSDSSALLEGLIGSEENRFAIHQLLATPDEYACNKFAAQCTDPPETLPAAGGDPQAELFRSAFREGDFVVDFGAGKGRFLEELFWAAGEEAVGGLRYFAYDVDDKDAAECKAVMSRCGVSPENYFNHREPLLKTVGGQADYVLLVNVLHEIDPRYWVGIFSTIRGLLKDTGHLVIVEREELTIGEAPYDNGFLMMTEGGAQKLFGIDNCAFMTHPQKTYIVKHIIKREGLEVTDGRLKECLLSIRDSAYRKIGEIKRGRAENNMERYRMGIRLAFCLHQYANASLNLDAVAAAETGEGRCLETAGAHR